MLSWKYRDPGRLLAERIGAAPNHTGYTGNGGNSPQALVNGAAADIAAGRADVVLVGGAESWRTRMRLRAQGERPAWTVQDESVPTAELLVPEVPMATDAETRIGLDRPAYVYPLFEQSLRISLGRTVGDHLAAVGELWARFSKVAATNPHAWTQREHTAAEIVTPNPGNRWISWPYPKLLNSNNMVEQAARYWSVRPLLPPGSASRVSAGCSPSPAPRRTTPSPSPSGTRCTGHRRSGSRVPRRCGSPASAWTTSHSSTCTPASRPPCRLPHVSSGSRRMIRAVR